MSLPAPASPIFLPPSKPPPGSTDKTLKVLKCRFFSSASFLPPRSSSSLAGPTPMFRPLTCIPFYCLWSFSLEAPAPSDPPEWGGSPPGRHEKNDVIKFRLQIAFMFLMHGERARGQAGRSDPPVFGPKLRPPSEVVDDHELEIPPLESCLAPDTPLPQTLWLGSTGLLPLGLGVLPRRKPYNRFACRVT